MRWLVDGGVELNGAPRSERMSMHMSAARGWSLKTLAGDLRVACPARLHLFSSGTASLSMMRTTCSHHALDCCCTHVRTLSAAVLCCNLLSCGRLPFQLLFVIQTSHSSAKELLRLRTASYSCAEEVKV